MERDGRVQWLPDLLPESPDFLWTADLTGDGLGGIAAAQGFVIAGSRDALDRRDVFQCFDQQTGTQVWQHTYPAAGSLDYGNSPRATPLIHGEYVYTLGAFGHLCCLELETGILLWQKNIAAEFEAPKLTWGHAGSPVIADDRLILQPGGRDASLVALDVETGDMIWQTPGHGASYASLLLKSVEGRLQVIGYDAGSLGGWDVETGKRLWSIVPAQPGDFNVPTVVSLNQQIVVSSENNGTRIHDFRIDGVANSQPLMQNEDLKPDSHTPVICGGRVFGIWGDLYGLDPNDRLKTSITVRDDAFAGYGSLVASDSKLLALSWEGELLLLSVTDHEASISSRLKLTSGPTQILSHPALAGDSLYVRIGSRLARLRLSASATQQ